MREHQCKATIDFGEEHSGTVTPARNNLETIDPKSRPADEKKRNHFYRMSMLIMHVSQIGRRDLQLTASFLSQCANVCAEEDHSKLKRSTRYAKETIYELPCLGASDLSVMINLIDATHGVHDDHKSYTGTVSTMGYGFFASARAKQKLNAKSSTK